LNLRFEGSGLARLSTGRVLRCQFHVVALVRVRCALIRSWFTVASVPARCLITRARFVFGLCALSGRLRSLSIRWRLTWPHHRRTGSLALRWIQGRIQWFDTFDPSQYW